MKKKGFTLIELLAVIVILAIIALIATPIVMNTIENAKKGAAERSAENYLSAVETEVAKQRIDGVVLEGEYTIQEDGNLCPAGETCTDETEIKIDMSGNKPSSGIINIENGKVVDKLSAGESKKTTMTVDEYTVSYNSETKQLVASKEESGANTTTTVYRWSDEEISIGDTIVPANYTTDSSTLGKGFYLKHVLDKDNKVIESWVCANEKCVRGGSSEFYGYASNPDDYTGNALIIKGLFDGGFCNTEAGGVWDSNSSCYMDSFQLVAISNGTVYSGNGDSMCTVNNNTSYCVGS